MAKTRKSAKYREKGFDATVLNYQTPRTVEELVPYQIKYQVMRLPAEYKNLTEEDFIDKYGEPSNSTVYYRRSFWAEYDYAIQHKTAMRFDPLYELVSARLTFERYIKKPEVLAYILIPPREYMARTEDLLEIGLRRIGEILKLPISNERTGEVNTKVGDLILKATMMLDMRLKGGYTQKTQAINLNVNENKLMVETKTSEVTNPVRSLDEKLAELEKQLSEGAYRVSKPLQIEGHEHLESEHVIEVQSESVVTQEKT
jgi:hypothetical protein